MITNVAFLRGINVGGKNQLSMKALAEIFVKAGCRDVQTYIQSGNVIFRASDKIAANAPQSVAEQITKQFGYHTPVTVRTADQLRAVFAQNPYLKAGVPEDFLHVMFLADRPSADRVAALDPQRSASDEFLLRSSEIYLKLPNGAAKTKLTNAYFDAKLSTVSTQRNWRTVGKLVKMLDG